MASNINSYNIDGTFPIAGQDNDSQGFRDNFTNTRTNLTFAKEEIEDLQNKVVLKTALAGGTVSNTFNNVLFTGVKMKAFTEEAWDLGLATGAQAVQFTHGHLQTLTTNASVTVNLSGWPTAGMYSKIRVWIDVTNVTHTMTIGAEVTLGKDEIQGFVGNVLTFPAVGEYIFEFSTNDGGSTVVIREITSKLQKANIIRSTPAAAVGIAGDKAGLLAADATYLYVCTGAFDNATSIWKRITLSSY